MLQDAFAQGLKGAQVEDVLVNQSASVCGQSPSADSDLGCL